MAVGQFRRNTGGNFPRVLQRIPDILVSCPVHQQGGAVSPGDLPGLGDPSHQSPFSQRLQIHRVLRVQYRDRVCAVCSGDIRVTSGETDGQVRLHIRCLRIYDHAGALYPVYSKGKRIFKLIKHTLRMSPTFFSGSLVVTLK